jgi:hypothetical protein
MNTAKNDLTALETAAVAASIERLLEDADWALHHSTRDYVDNDIPYDHYAPAYLYGIASYQSNPERQFDDYEGELASGWTRARSGSPLEWPTAKPAVREAWYRISDLTSRAKSERANVLSSADAVTPGDH